MGCSYYRNAECFIICFDLSYPRTFENVDAWRMESLTQLNPKDPLNFPIILLGTKCDLEGRKVNINLIVL